MRHHLDPVTRLEAYSLTSALLPELPGASDLRIQSDAGQRGAIARANSLVPMDLSDADVAALLAFLKALEDPAERLGVPERVPSGLPVDR